MVAGNTKQAKKDMQPKISSSSHKVRKSLERENLLPGYVLDLDWCESMNFTELLACIEFQRWSMLFDRVAMTHIYPFLMDEFLSTFKYNEGECTARVKGVNLRFDESVLASLFQTPNLGFDNYVKNQKNVDVNGSSVSDIMKFFKVRTKNTTFKQDKLKPFHKLLFNFVRRSVIPRSQKKNEVNLMDACLIFCLDKKISINFPALMISHLSHCIPDLKIPYAPFITVIMRSFGVPMDNELHYGINSAFIVNEDSLRKLSLKVVQGTLSFIPKGKTIASKKKERVPSEEEEEYVEGEVEGHDVHEEEQVNSDEGEEVGEEEEEKEEDEEENEEDNEQVDDVGTESEDSGRNEREIIMKDQRKKRGLPRGWTSVPTKTRRSSRIANIAKPPPSSPIHIDLVEPSPPHTSQPPSPPQKSPSPQPDPSPQKAPTTTPSPSTGFAAFSNPPSKLELEVQGVSKGLVDLRKDVADMKDKVLSWEVKMEDLLKNAVTTLTAAVEQSNAKTLESVRELGFQYVEEEVPDS